jgi:(R,R)-butanediol dehydrogenase/meso-butanediol dehydrogenase/diacetyl reductase
MRALVYSGPDQLGVEDVSVPDLDVDGGDVLVRVKYIGICGTDLHLWHGGIATVEPPVVVGHEVVGEVAAVNVAVSRFAPGDRVAVEPLLSCGECLACRAGHGHVCRRLRVLGVHANGGAAEYMRVPAKRLHPVPAELSWEVAACAEPTAVAVHMTRRAGIQLGDTVLVLGGGPIGFLVASVATAAGAGRVLVSEISPRRLELCRQAGLETVDARTIDPIALVQELTDGEGADVVVEAVGQRATVGQMVRAARPRGTVLVGGLGEPSPVDLSTVVFKELSLVGSRVYESRDFDTALGLLASGEVDVTPLVTRIVPLEDAIAGAFKPLRDSRDEMKILLTPVASGQ